MKKLVNVRHVVNASGRMTKLGVSTPSQRVLAAMNEGAAHYVVMDELLSAVNQRIAELTGANAACVVASASSGIALVIASLIAKKDIVRIEQLYHYRQQQANEVLLLKGHNINYGAPVETMIALGGGRVKEVGSANLATVQELEAAISEDTLALFYVKSHHAVQKNMVSWQDMIAIAHKYNLPIIIDAAAEEDLNVYHSAGADYVIYSGTKALQGPTSGFVLANNKERAENIQLQYQGIGRAMKVGKEAIYGLLQAVEDYVHDKPQTIIKEAEVQNFMEQVKDVQGVSASWETDEAGRAIKRIALHIDEKAYGKNAKELSAALQLGNPAIFLRDYEANNGVLSIDQRPLLEGDLAVIYQKLQEEKRK